jgi:two-component system CheB/CheR fusion protein
MESMQTESLVAAQPQAAALISLWLDQARDHAVVVLDTAGVIIGWLGAAELLLGYSAEEAMGQHIALIFTGDDRAKGYPNYELKVAAEDSHAEDSRWHLRKDGTRIWVSGTASAVRDPSGEVIGFVKLMRDVTDQRARTERFENELSQLGDAREKTHRFLRTLGHELRNPLSVLANIEGILARVVSDERGQKAVQQLSAQVKVLMRLADDLMDVTRLELGKLHLELEAVDLRDLLNSGVASQQSAAARKSITLETLLPPTPLVVSVDPARIQQVVLNLLTNAIKYTHTGGSVWVRAGEEGNEVVCRIQDTGIGIFPPVLPKIFDLFTQAPEGEDMRGGGIGVGLALVRQIVDLHGGTVQAKSPGLGKGSEFSFRLPVPGTPMDLPP